MIGKFLMSRLNERDEYDPSMFHEFLDNYLITNKIKPEPGLGTNLKNGLVKAKPYTDAINSTYVLIGGLITTGIGLYLRFKSMDDLLLTGKKNVLFDVEEDDDNKLEETRNHINKELRRRRSVTKSRGRSVSRAERKK